MNISTSECSSGCESGWTTYLDQLSNSTDPYNRAFPANCGGKEAYVDDDDQEDEDLSMVSDASSGPPHFYDNYPVQTQYYGYSNNISAVSEDKKKIKKKSKPKKQQSLCLDDTASSSIFHFSKDNVHSSAYHNTVENVPSKFEGESITKKHLGFFKSSTKGKSGSLLGRKRQ